MKVTGYETYTQLQLHSLFSTETWNSLSFDDRINACQEVENRYALENGCDPCTITHHQLDGASYGWQKGKTICLNTSLVRDGVFITSITDSAGNQHYYETSALAPSWNTLDTVYHEGTHGIQEASGTMPSTYISPEMDGDLYRIQRIEKEAYAAGQSKTLSAISDVEEFLGQLDSSRDEYFASVKNDSFQSALQDASQHYSDPCIENTLNNVISDRDNGLFPSNTSRSYQSIAQLCDNYNLRASIESENAGLTNSLSELDGINTSLSADNPLSNNLQIHDDGIDSCSMVISSSDNSYDDGINVSSNCIAEQTGLSNEPSGMSNDQF